MTTPTPPDAPGLAQVALLVHDYDEAIAWFTAALGFALAQDSPLGAGKRWVVLDTGGGARLLLARAVGAEQAVVVGRQAGGRVGFFLHTADFDGALARLRAHGAAVEGVPRSEPYGRVAVFADLYGNRWDLIGPAPA